MTKGNYIYPGFREINSNEPIRPKNKDLPTKVPRSVKESLELYKRVATVDEINGLYSTLYRRIIPALGGKKPKGKRISEQEKEDALAVLEATPFAEIQKFPTLLEEELKKQNVDSKKAKKERHYINRFVKESKKQGWIEPASPNPDRYYRFKENQKSRPYADDYQIMPGRPSHKNRQKVYIEDLNEKCQQDLADFEDFLKNECNYKPATIKRDIETFLRILGWLNAVKEIPLEELDLTKIVEYSTPPQSLKRKNFTNSTEYYEAKAIAEEEMEDIKDKTLNFWKEFSADTKTSKSTQITYLKSLKNLVMYLYQNDTKDKRIKNGYKDIPIMKEIRDSQHFLNNESKKEPKRKNAPEQQQLTWDEVVDVVEKHRIEFEQPIRYSVRYSRRRQKGNLPIEKVTRTDSAIGDSLKKFLILSFYTIIPPCRPRDLMNLQLNKSFIQGNFEGGMFYPISQMREPEKALWWINFNCNEYKTGATYGVWQVPIPNITYKNGKTFYDYINSWINDYRAVFKPNHDFLFTKKNGKPLDSLHQLVKHAICRFTNAPVTPQMFRHIFITHLKHIGATEEQLDSAAATMRHSRETQKQYYDLQDRQEKMETILSYTKNTVQNHLNP